MDDLRKHLKQAEKNQMLEIWDDGEILAGQEWDKAIKLRLETAQLILMLVSVDFINSDYIEKTELQAALQRHRDGEATLIPIIVRRCDWYEHFGIGKFQALPKEARPIKSVDVSIREEIYYEVAQGIKTVAQEMKVKIDRDAERLAAEIALAASAAEAQRAKEAAAEQAKEAAKQDEEVAATRKAAENKRQQLKDEAAWKAALEIDSLEAYEDYSEKYTLHEAEAHERIGKKEEAEAKRRAELKAKDKAEAARLAAKTQLDKEAALKNAREGKARKKRAEDEAERADPFQDLMIPIKGGTFVMGDTFGDGGSWEKPVHKVTVPDFHLCKYPVTQRQWKAIMGDDPSHFKGDDLPVENVSWDNVQKFIQKLNEQTGKNYRLPTEAEWEYAAREGGKKVRFGNGKDIADPKEINFNGTKDYKKPYSVEGEYRGKTTPAFVPTAGKPVSQFKPNALGLHDMSGNVWEWCQDVWHENYNGAPEDGSAWEKGDNSFRVLRGGSWSIDPEICRVANRRGNNPNYRNKVIGFRVVRGY